ncbi:MAG TPA: hypothetical protein VFH60_05745 [Chloroflexia bacterium]|nr:hypothetical protein [Chloroflexia bacterium]
MSTLTTAATIEETRAEPRAESRARVSRWQHWHLGALLAHLGLSIVVTWPLVLNFLPGSGTLVPGVMLEDRDQNLWNLWWVRRALFEGHNPFVTDLIWYPTPVSLYYHTLNVFNGLLAVPLLSVFSLTTTYNLIVLFSFVMGGYGAYLLVHYLCGNRWAALVGSVVFAYSAYHVATMRSLLQLISLEWVPFFLFFLLKALFQPGWESRADFVRWLWRRALPAGFFLFLVSLVDWYYTMYALMLAGLLGVYMAVRYLWEKRRHPEIGLARGVLEPLLRIGACLAIYLVLVSPILVPTIRELRQTNYMQPARDASLSNSADLLAFFQPVRGQHLWGQYFTNRREWPYGSNRYEVYFTYTALFLAGVALFATRALRPRARASNERDDAEQTRSPHASVPDAGRAPPVLSLPGKWFWAALVLLFFVLALGPVLQINGNQVLWLFSPNLPLVMPYQLLEKLPVFSISRSPDRFDMPLTLCLAVLAGYGTNVLLNTWWPRLRVSARGGLLFAGFLVLVLVELTPFPYPQRPADIPRWYHQVGSEPGDFSILDLPPQDDYWHGAYRMYFQTAHGKPIFGGYISREFPHPFLPSTPGYQELTYVDGAGDMFKSGPDEWLSAFQLYKTKYIVLQKVRLPDKVEPVPDIQPSREAIHYVLGADATPVYEDEQVEVYLVPSPRRTVPFMSVGEGWEPREVGPNGTYRWMHGQATLRIDAPASGQAYLTFRAASLGRAKPLQVLHGDHVVFDGPVGGLQPFKIGPLGIPQGVSTLTFISPEGTNSPRQLGQGDDPRQLSFVLLDAALEPVP